MERARRASAAAAHAAWEALRGRAPAVPDDPLGADDVDVVDGDDEIVVEDDAADDAEGSDADEAAEGGDDDAAADAVGRAELDHVESKHPYDTLPEIEPPSEEDVDEEPARGRGQLP